MGTSAECDDDDDDDDDPALKVTDKVLKRAITVLREHFDTVQIFVTKQSDDDEKTWDGTTGSGNFLARKGQVIEWMTRQDEMMRHHTRLKFADDEE